MPDPLSLTLMPILPAAFEDTLKLPVLWHISGIIFVLLLMAARRLACRGGIFTIFAWSLIPTMAHELTHYLMGKLTLAGVRGVTLVPRREGNRLVLGAVSFSKLNPINSPLVALAPLTLLLGAYFLFINWTLLFKASMASTVGLYIALYLLLYAAVPSTTDFKTALNWKSIALYGTAAYLGYLAWKGLH